MVNVRDPQIVVCRGRISGRASNSRRDEAEEAHDFFAEHLSKPNTEQARLHFEFIGALIHEHRGRWAEASQSFRRCIALTAGRNPEAAGASRNGLARVLIAQSSFAEAILVIEGTDDTNSDPYHAVLRAGLLAFAHVGAGELDKARQVADECIERAIELELFDLTARLHFAQAFCHWQEFDREAARAAIRRSASLDLSPLNRELCLVLDAWFSDEPLPEPSHVLAVSLARFIQGDHSLAAVNGPTEAVLTAVLEARKSRFVLGSEGKHLTVAGKRHDLSQRTALRRILLRLVEARERDQGPVATGDLFEAGWPDTKHVGANGLRRVYTEIHRLRKLGLDLESVDGGYHLVTAIEMQT